MHGSRADERGGLRRLDSVDRLVLADGTFLGTSGTLWTTQTATGLGNDGYGTISGS